MLPARNVLGASSKDGELNFMPTALPLKAMAKVLETESATETGPRWSRSRSRGPANCGIVTGRRPRSTCTLKLPKGHTQDTHRTHTHSCEDAFTNWLPQQSYI